MSGTEKPERIVVRLSVLRRENRLDFAYYLAKKEFSRLAHRRTLGWRELGELATVTRGSVGTPLIGESALHTSDYKDGYWRAATVTSSGKAPVGVRICTGDILVKRVSRNCSQTFGLTRGATGRACTDCVLVVRPRRSRESTRILFAIRCMMGLGHLPSLIQRGTGASLLSATALRKLRIPSSLYARYPRLYKRYHLAQKRGDFTTVLEIESRIQSTLSKS